MPYLLGTFSKTQNQGQVLVFVSLILFFELMNLAF